MSAPKRQRTDEPARRGLSLLVGEPWTVRLRAGARQLTGTLRTSEDPHTKALSLHMDLAEDPAAGQAPPAAAGSPLALPQALSRAEERPRRATGPPPADAAARRASGSSLSGAQAHKELDLRRMKCNGPTHTKKDRAAALRDALRCGVTRLVGVMCESDPDTVIWSRQLLQLAAPTVVELSLHGARDEHLRALYTMPQLRRLEMHVDPTPPQSALPEGHAGLQWLSVSGLTRATLQSLLQTHGRSLLQLQLWVGTAVPSSDMWPHSCSDLHSLLEQCNLAALKKLVLQRQGVAHDLLQCGKQVKDVFEALLGAVSVKCSRCDAVEVEYL